MSAPKIIKRLIVCFGSIQLVTALSVLSYREKQQQELNLQYENYLIITPLFAPQGQSDDFAALIEKMARAIYPWENIVYMPLEQKQAIAKKVKQSGLSEVANSVCQFIGSKDFDEIYLAHEYDFEDQLLMNLYKSAEKICYGNGIGIYTAQPAFPKANLWRDSQNYLHFIYIYLKEKIRLLRPQKQQLSEEKADIGYFSLPFGFGQEPSLPTVILKSDVYRETFQSLRKKLNELIDIQYIDKLHAKIQSNSTSVLLTSNFSESGRISEENEIAAYREFLVSQGIDNNEILLIKPHPRTSKQKLMQLKSALSDLYADIILLAEDFLFYLPFELLFMELFLNPDSPKFRNSRVFTFSSACLTLEFVLDTRCTLGFGNNIVKKFFYPDHIDGRIKHEEDLFKTVLGIRESNAVLYASSANS
jgi:Alpha-2,8-polysialyltransferase (POLYST)